MMPPDPRIYSDSSYELLFLFPSSFALKDYVALNLTGTFDDPLLEIMMEMVDPYSYFNNSNLANIPKFIVSAAGDEFLLTDNVLSFWDDLLGEKHFVSWPNLEHSMGGNPFEVITTVLSYTVQVELNQTRPDYYWTIDEVDGGITVVVNSLPFPETINFWYAETIDGEERRDFRLATCPDGCPNPKKVRRQYQHAHAHTHRNHMHIRSIGA